ncbi:urotensin-2 receptor-like [Genypterus blacodes]|uniref:urotensin-2 receptor-like n=1 Tax=Genypterus blacodes TaxID=154954 RepID=UPI003F761832
MTVNNSAGVANCLWASSSSSSPSCVQTEHIIAGLILSGCCLVGVPTNIFVIASLGRRLRRTSITIHLLFSLAVSDILTLLCLPVGMVMFYNGFPLTDALCYLYFFFFFFCLSSGFITLVLMSIQRYFQVLHPKKWAWLSKRDQKVLVLGAWVLGALLSLPVLFCLRDDGAGDEGDARHSCTNLRIMPILEVVYSGLTVASYLILLYFYLRLVRGVNRVKLSNKYQSRMAKIILRILAASLAFSIPPLVLRVLHAVAALKESPHLLQLSKKLVFVECLYFLNPCLNPFLYFFSSRDRKGRDCSKGRESESCKDGF